MMEAPKKYRKKPVIIEALQWTGYNYTQSEVFCGEPVAGGVYEGSDANGWPAESAYSCSTKIISTLEGDMKCTPGDWIIKGVKGEFYPCKPDIFEATYEQVIP